MRFLREALADDIRWESKTYIQRWLCAVVFLVGLASFAAAMLAGLVAVGFVAMWLDTFSTGLAITFVALIVVSVLAALK